MTKARHMDELENKALLAGGPAPARF